MSILVARDSALNKIDKVPALREGKVWGRKRRRVLFCTC